MGGHISHIHTGYIRWGFLYFRYLKCLVIRLSSFLHTIPYIYMYNIFSSSLEQEIHEEPKSCWTAKQNLPLDTSRPGMWCNKRSYSYSPFHGLQHGFSLGWWFQTFVIFTLTWGDDPTWLFFGLKPPTTRVSMEVIVTNVSKLGLFHLFRGRIQPTYIGVNPFTKYQQDIPVAPFMAFNMGFHWLLFHPA